MRIYQLSVNHAHEGSTISYHASKSEAERTGKNEERDSTSDPVQFFHVTPIDFKPTKKGILAMLNAHTPDHDNG